MSRISQFFDTLGRPGRNLFAGSSVSDVTFKGLSFYEFFMGFLSAFQEDVNAVVSGTAQITETDTAATIDLRAAGYTDADADSLAVAGITAKSGTSASAYVASAAVDGTGVLTVTLDAAPGAGETTDINYIVDTRPSTPATWWTQTLAALRNQDSGL